MKVEFSKDIVHLSEFEIDDDGNVAHCDIQGLKCLEMDEKDAFFEPCQFFWRFHVLNGIGQYECGMGVDMEGCYNDC